MVILNTANGTCSHFLMDFSLTLTSTMPRCSGWDVCHMEDEGFQLLSPHYTFGVPVLGGSNCFLHRSVIPFWNEWLDLIKKLTTGFQSDFFSFWRRRKPYWSHASSSNALQQRGPQFKESCSLAAGVASITRMEEKADNVHG